MGLPVKRKNSLKIECCVSRQSDYTSRCVERAAATCVAFEHVSSGITEWVFEAGPQCAVDPVSGAIPAEGGWRDVGLPSARKNSPKIEGCVFRQSDYMSRCVEPGATTCVLFERVFSGITEKPRPSS